MEGTGRDAIQEGAGGQGESSWREERPTNKRKADQGNTTTSKRPLKKRRISSTPSSRGSDRGTRNVLQRIGSWLAKAIPFGFLAPLVKDTDEDADASTAPAEGEEDLDPESDEDAASVTIALDQDAPYVMEAEQEVDIQTRTERAALDYGNVPAEPDALVSEGTRENNTVDGEGTQHQAQSCRGSKPQPKTSSDLRQPPNATEATADEATQMRQDGERVHRDILHSTYTAREMHNVIHGTNYGTINQKHITVHRERLDLPTILNPILDASHTRNLRVSPPHSKCFPKTRERVIGIVLSWAKADLGETDPHILWIYGYAGCGKSAISQAVAEQLSREGRLAASFFFFRGAGDRGMVTQFATTIASQVANSVPATAHIIEDTIWKNPSLLSTTTSSLGNQFECLVYDPITAVASLLPNGPMIVVLDGVDECKDRDEITTFIEHMITFFNENPLTPVRVIIASRVEDHIHRELHLSSQVRLLNLVKHTSNEDISTALDVAIAKEMRGRAIPNDGSWPGWRDKRELVQQIGGSYIFMTTILKLLFAPSTKDGLTPMERLPQLLEMKPDFNSLYREILEPCSHFPFFLNITSTIALAFQPLSIAQIAELLNIKPFNVTNILINLHAIIQVPGDDHSPVTLWHTSLRDFLCSEDHAGCFFAGPIHHRCIADGAIHVATSSSPSKSHQYARKYGMDHLFQYLKSINQEETSYDVLLGGIMSNLVKATFQDDKTALEVACHTKEWKLVQALVNAGANVNTQFQGERNGIRVVLHAACHYKAKETVYFLLEKGADPNIVATKSIWSSDWGYYAFPLVWAAAQGDVDLVNQLLACGADPNLKGGQFGSALHVCALYGKDEVAQVLLEHGVDVNIKNDSDWTPLHYASLNGHINVAKCLLEFNTDPNLQDGDGDTPLHNACLYGSVDVAECLLDHNADPSIRNKWGQTALQHARDRGKQKVVDMLQRRGITE